MNNNTSTQSGVTGHQGSTGVTGFSITNVVEDTLNKYGNRFKMERHKVNDALLPELKLTDNFTLKQHTFKPITMIGIKEELQDFINNIIIDDRSLKIDNVIKND